MTWREIEWAADGRQQAEWGRAASIMTHISWVMCGQRIDPNALMPDRYREPEPPQTPEQEARENELAWKILDQGLQGIADGCRSRSNSSR